MAKVGPIISSSDILKKASLVKFACWDLLFGITGDWANHYGFFLNPSPLFLCYTGAPLLLLLASFDCGHRLHLENSRGQMCKIPSSLIFQLRQPFCPNNHITNPVNSVVLLHDINWLHPQELLSADEGGKNLPRKRRWLFLLLLYRLSLAWKLVGIVQQVVLDPIASNLLLLLLLNW